MNGLNHTLSGESRNPAVLFLHGFMGSTEDWQGVISALEDRFFCVAVDLPGHGASLGLPEQDHSFEGSARAILELLDRLEIKHATFAGYSMGGRLALYLALRHPERCDGLFLESTSPGLKNEAERRDRRASDEKLVQRLETEDFERFLDNWHRQPLFASLSRHEGLVEELVSKRLNNEPNELARSLRGMGTGSQPSLWDELPSLWVPALAVAGELDEKFVGIACRMASLSPRMRDVSVAGARHNVHVERPAEYLRLLEEFLGVDG